MGINISGQQQPNTNEHVMEVYLLVKKVGQESYLRNNPQFGHHICLLKTFDGKFYYTDLQTVNGDKNGKIQLRFEKYEFIKPAHHLSMIYYIPLGHTTKSLSEIETYAKVHRLNGQDYSLLSQNCQHYAQMCQEFLEIDPVPEKFSSVHTARNPEDLTLRPDPINKVVLQNFVINTVLPGPLRNLF